MNKQITNHPNFDPSDYAYFVAKGWTDEEILERWTQERAEGKRPQTWNSFGAKLKLNATINAR